VADLFGDWREEVVWRNSTNTQLQIWSTTIAATNRVFTLMHDVQYRESVAWQNVGYNQPTATSFYLGSVESTGTQFAPIPTPSVYYADAVPPGVIRFSFSNEVSPNTLSVKFSKYVLPSIATGDLGAQLLRAGATPLAITPTDVSYDSATDTATWTLPMPLADGNYSVSIAAASVSDPAGRTMSGDYAAQFFVLAGDANRDRHVDAADQAILTAHLGQTGTFSTGDFNYDGVVNAGDQSILDANKSAWLPPQGPLALPATGGDDALALRLDASPGVLDLFYGSPAPADPSDRLLLVAVTALSFDGAAGSDSLTVLGGSGTDTSTFSASSLTLGPITIAHANVEQLFFNGAGGFDDLTVNAIAVVTLPTTQEFASLRVAGTLISAPSGSSGFGLLTRSLSINGSGSLDLNDNDLILDYSGTSPLAAVQGWISAARANGAWTGSGITSSAARDNPAHNTTLGVIDRADYTGSTFDGEPLDTDMVLVKYTYYGDASFDGRVTFDDYVRIDTGFNAQRAGWSNGDFNLDGVVNFDDYVLIDTAFNSQGAPLARVVRSASDSRLRPR
jgi:hypothetical protein